MLRIIEFKKYYGDQLALQIPDLLVPEGIHWFKGGNGAGKSTLFKSLAGIIPFQGEVFLHNINLRKDAVAYRMKVNYAEAEPIFPPFLNGQDLIRFVREAKKAPEGQEESLVQQLKMESYIGNNISTYSSGMLKKVSLVMAFLGNPHLIILDEPLITIDKEAAAAILQLIQEYAKRGTSFLLSSHQDFEVGTFPIDATFLLQDKTVLHEVRT